MSGSTKKSKDNRPDDSGKTMMAAVVEAFDKPPRYRACELPVAQAGEAVVAMHAAALSQLVRAQAGGRHYSSGTPPLVPGVDGVGILPDGKRVYFAFPRAPFGAMAEHVAVRAGNIVPLPDDVDDVTAAAIANPGMSSWAALNERAHLLPGESVLINGANGASGRLAIQIAKYLGAARVIASARNAHSESTLRALGADEFVHLTPDWKDLVAQFRGHIARGVNVVLDYLWGPPAEAFFAAATGQCGHEAAPRIRFVNIGSLAGPIATLTASALRSSGIELLGSGLGSLPHAALIRSVGRLMNAAGPAGLKIDAKAFPLSDVEAAWSAPHDARIVFTA